MEVTVLMPVYNAEKYLHDSISSLLCQTSSSWKLICVDDGSSDNSLSILLDYEKKINEGLGGEWKMKVLSQENAGPGVARARAIEIADTEYVSILDTDDTYALDYVEQMLKRAEETLSSIIVPNVRFSDFRERLLTDSLCEFCDAQGIIEGGEKAFSLTFPWQLHGWFMIKTSLAKQYYTFNEVSYSKFNSDEYVTRMLYLKVRNIALCNTFYKYRITPNSITRKISIVRYDYLKTIEKLVLLCKQEDVSYDIRVKVFNDFFVTLGNLSNSIKELPENNQQLARELVNSSYEKYKRYLDCKIILKSDFRNGVKFILSFLSLKIIRICVK